MVCGPAHSVIPAPEIPGPSAMQMRATLSGTSAETALTECRRRGGSRVRVGRAALAIAAAALGACSLLPTSGPSRAQVQGAGSTGIQIIDLTDAVARQLVDSRKQHLFSDDFPVLQPSNEIVGPGDVLEISVWEAPPAALFASSSLNNAALSVSNMTVFPQQMVNADGIIYVPFAGTVPAAGKSLQEIGAEIARQLHGKANQPQVLARLVVNNTAYVTVVGEVVNSTRVALTPRGEHLLDALAAAGGTREPVDKITLQVTRGTTVRSLPLDTVIRDPRQNIALRPGDVVTAFYQPLSFTALGATGKSDEVNFEARGISLAQALARVGGLLDTHANAQGVFIFRFEQNDALRWPTTPLTTPEGSVPVVYRVDLRDPRSFFVAQSFPMRDKDVLYVATAPAAEMQKFKTLVGPPISPLQPGHNASEVADAAPPRHRRAGNNVLRSPLLLAACWILGARAAHAGSAYFGEADWATLEPAGCNATALAQLPGSSDLFIGRQLLTADGRIAGVDGPNDCSGGNPDNRKAGKIFNRWSLTLDRLDWQARRFSIVKPLLDTSIEPGTGHSRAAITGGPMRGAVIRSAYDASVVSYRGEQLVAYECVLEEPRFGVQGTSACLSAYDPTRQVIDLSRTQVIVSGVHAGGRFYAAAVPELLVFQGRLYLYWSALAVDAGKFVEIAVRGAELETSGGTLAIRGGGGALVHCLDRPATTEVWSPSPGDPASDSAVDIRALWVSGGSVVAMASVGGSACASPAGDSRGCFRLSIVRAQQPLGEGVFNHAPQVEASDLPSNPQEYTRPVRDPSGHYWLMGHYLRPKANGGSEDRPVPDPAYWKAAKPNGVLVMYPVPDGSLWPSDTVQ